MRHLRTHRFPTSALLPFGLCLLLCSSPLLTPAAAAQPPAPGAGFDSGFGSGFDALTPGPVKARDGGGLVRLLRFLGRFLDLSDEQKADTRALLEQLHTDLQPLREDSRGLAAELRTALDAETPDPLEVGGLVIALDANRDASAALRQAFLSDFEALLTPEQLELFERLWETLQ